MHWSGNKKK